MLNITERLVKNNSFTLSAQTSLNSLCSPWSIKQLETQLLQLKQKERAGGNSSWLLPHYLFLLHPYPQTPVKSQLQGFWEDCLKTTQKEGYYSTNTCWEYFCDSRPVPISHSPGQICTYLVNTVYRGSGPSYLVLFFFTLLFSCFNPLFC